MVIATPWAVECNVHTHNRKQFRYKPYTWKPVNDSWQSYTVESAEVQEDVGVLEALFAKWRDTSKQHRPQAPPTSPFASFSETSWDPGVLLIDYRKVDDANFALWGEVFPKLFAAVVNNDFQCTFTRDYRMTRQHRIGRAYISFLGQRLGRTADQHHAVDPEEKPANILGALKFTQSCDLKYSNAWSNTPESLASQYTDASAMLFGKYQTWENFLQQMEVSDMRSRAFQASWLQVRQDNSKEPFPDNMLPGIWQMNTPLFMSPLSVAKRTSQYPNEAKPWHHVLCNPKERQGFCNRICTISNAMLLASYLQWGIVIIWESTDHCNSQSFFDHFDDKIRRHPALSFVKVYENVQQYERHKWKAMVITLEQYSMPTGFAAKVFLELNHSEDDDGKWNNFYTRPGCIDFTKHIADHLQDKYRLFVADFKKKACATHWNKTQWQCKGWTGFHVRRGDMVTMQQLHCNRDLHVEDQWLLNTIGEAINWKRHHVYIATDDKCVYDLVSTTFDEECKSSTIVFHPSHEGGWSQKGTGKVTEIRTTSIDVFLEDILMVASCNEVYACKYSTVKVLLRALTPPWTTYIEQGPIFKSMITMTAPAIEELRRIFEANRIYFLDAHCYFMPHFDLSEDLILLLASIPDSDVATVYADLMNKKTTSMQSKCGTFVNGCHLGNVLENTQAIKHVQTVYKTIVDNSKTVIRNSRHVPGFLTALIWTRLKSYSILHKKAILVSVGDWIWHTELAYFPAIQHWIISQPTGSFANNQKTLEILQHSVSKRQFYLYKDFVDHQTQLRQKHMKALQIEQYNSENVMQDDDIPPWKVPNKY